MDDTRIDDGVTNYVVIDDISRFALHVWLSLTDSISIGIGRYKDVENHLFWGDDVMPSALTTSNRGARVWWVPATSEWRDRLQRVLEASAKTYSAKPTSFFFIFDYKNKPGDYQVDKAFRAARAFIDERRFLVVSSYGLGRIRIDGLAEPVRILPKSPATLATLQRGVERQVTAKPPGSHANVLVTGAGFEIRKRPGPGGFGLPSTARILQEMDDVLIKVYFERADDQFPVPGKKLELDDGLKKRITNIAERGLLDEYWNIILENQHEWLRQIGTSASGEKASELREDEESILQAAEVRKQEVWRREFSLRDSFRRSILRHDWGHLSQCLAAGKQPWHAWLTTNYTHFSDRAVALLSDHREELADNFTPWRIIATANEAAVFLREQRHAQEHSDETNGEESRFLFKLHGDIGRLQTMAIAGQDKEVFGNLSVPIDSLHQIYSAVEFYLTRTLRTTKQDRWRWIVWHIVGHGLQDRRLLRVIEETCRATHDKSTEFVIVNLEKDVYEVAARLRRFLETEKIYDPERQKIRVFKGTAEEYMAALEWRAGLCAGDVEDWLRRVRLPFEDWTSPDPVAANGGLSTAIRAKL